jgi:hypothetical protein
MMAAPKKNAAVGTAAFQLIVDARITSKRTS